MLCTAFACVLTFAVQQQELNQGHEDFSRCEKGKFHNKGRKGRKELRQKIHLGGLCVFA
jgi:hypothetical protein